MDAKLQETLRTQERELWLLVIGASLSNKSCRADLFSRIDLSDVPGEEIGGILAALKVNDSKAAWEYMKRFGIQENGGRTVIQVAVEELRRRIAKRHCEASANKLRMFATQEPSEYVKQLERHLEQLKVFGEPEASEAKSS